MADFLPAYNITKGHEGGYVNDPTDKGGETYSGISRKFWPRWPGWRLVDAAKPLKRGAKIKNDDLEKLTRDFYEKEFWIAQAKGHLIHSQPMANFIYDTVVNHGDGERQIIIDAINIHRKAKGLAPSVITTSLQNVHVNYINANGPELYPIMIEEREKYYRSLGTFWRFGKGWLARLDSFGTSLKEFFSNKAVLITSLFFLALSAYAYVKSKKH